MTQQSTDMQDTRILSESCTFRKAEAGDLDRIEEIYDHIHTAEESGAVTIGWARGVYPTRRTAEEALSRGDIFVEECGGSIVGTAIINQLQVDVYAGADWQFEAADSEVMVLHTLVIDPESRGRGLGGAFVKFYEEFAAAHGCTVLRMDTNERNVNARAFYSRLGYREAGIAPCTFNGIECVHLVLLEKELGD